MCNHYGAHVPPDALVSKLSRIAASGEQPSNAERDLHVILQKMALNIDLEEVSVRMWDPKQSCIVRAKIPVLMPDKVAAAIWELGKDVFHDVFLGDFSRSDVKKYWDHVHSTSEWFRDHPAAAYPREGLIPLSLYGDEVQTYKGSEVGTIMVLAWCSDFAYNRSALHRYMLIATYSEYLACDETYDDLMGAVCDNVIKMVGNQESYPWSGEFQFMFSSNQGDLKFLLNNHHVHPYKNNGFCSWCLCTKSDPAGDVGMTLGDFRETATHRSTLISHEQYMQSTAPHERFLKPKASTIFLFLIGPRISQYFSTVFRYIFRVLACMLRIHYLQDSSGSPTPVSARRAPWAVARHWPSLERFLGYA